jgi:hypothetical protein
MYRRGSIYGGDGLRMLATRNCGGNDVRCRKGNV